LPWGWDYSYTNGRILRKFASVSSSGSNHNTKSGLYCRFCERNRSKIKKRAKNSEKRKAAKMTGKMDELPYSIGFAYNEKAELEQITQLFKRVRHEIKENPIKLPACKSEFLFSKRGCETTKSPMYSFIEERVGGCNPAQSVPLMRRRLCSDDEPVKRLNHQSI